MNQIQGRVIYHVRNILKDELKLYNYDYQNVADHLFQKEPYFSPDELTNAYQKGYPERTKVFEYYF